MIEDELKGQVTSVNIDDQLAFASTVTGPDGEVGQGAGGG